MSRRSYTMDIFRVAALLLVLVYHSWALTGSLPFRYGALTLVVALGGEIGVTAFFALRLSPNIIYPYCLRSFFCTAEPTCHLAEG